MASLKRLAAIRELAAIERHDWPVRMDAIIASGVPTNDGPIEDRTTVNIDAPITLDSLDARQQTICGRIAEIDNEFAGQALPEDIRSEWNGLNNEFEDNGKLIEELRARKDRVRALANTPTNREPGFHAPAVSRGNDPFDTSHVRGAPSLDAQRGMLRDQAMRAAESVRYPHPTANKSDCQAAVERALAVDDEFGSVARRILNTGNPVYQRAFGKTLQGRALTTEEQRALGLTNTAGGYAVPFTLDPTIIPTSNGAVNPYRQISRVIQIATTTWNGITSAGVTATRRSEADEVADNAPTLAQPSITPQRVDVFIPFSIEIGQDWQGMQGDLASLIQDAKDAEEATSFTTGGGTAPAAQGIVTGATTVVTAAGTASFAVADLYSVEAQLPPRFLPNAQWVASRAIYSRVRQFDTQGGASLWTQTLRDGLGTSLVGNTGYDLLGYPANVASPMAGVLTTGSLIAILGDFSRFVIVDRIGMDIELVPHLFGTNRRPTGQRGIFAMWRNNSKVLDANAFRVLKTG